MKFWFSAQAKREPFHARPSRLAGPVADGPLQPAQVLVVAGRGERRLADAAQEPLPVLLDVDDGVAGPARRARRRPGTPRSSRPRWRRRASRSAGESLSIRSFRPLFSANKSANAFSMASRPLSVPAGLVGVIAVRRPEGGQGLGVALVERLDERLGVLDDRRLVGSLVLGFLGPSGLAEKATKTAASDR